MSSIHVDLLSLRTALEESWRPDTANLGVNVKGNPALGQCYPSSRVIQFFFPESEIAEGIVITPSSTADKHFWNVFKVDDKDVPVDFTWQQFPPHSYVKSWKIRDRNHLNDSEPTIQRVNLLLERVKHQLAGSRF